MYGNALSAMTPSPVGSAPPLPSPPPQSQSPTPKPGPTPLPPAVVSPPPAPAAPINPAIMEAAQRKAYEDHLDKFLWHAANDYAARRIGRDDLKKAAAYSGTQPYEQWKQENVAHIKEREKAKD